MKRLPLLSALLTMSLVISAPAALAHVGHGDEFQAEGGVNRVEVNAETDPLFGIQVSPIEAAADGSGAVMIPVSALVADNGRQLVFVEYENFYEPVDVITGASQGELIEIDEGLSVGEQLVTQGSLSLYAESRKTQTADEAPEAVATASNEESVVESRAVESAAQAPVETAEAAASLPMGLLAAIGAVAVIVIGAVVVRRGGQQKGGV
ncbi:cobalt transporter [Leptolyngbya sp. Heron Island J]|uniref:hypothetical protein n=1 Tax=Leptolyngbya sp. Heron Island J TaxID=1385935 RepID=UPI0003B9A8AB|nr:hypothetical protein [Leptolyngbya sp. Heron Island J]ESA38945.1 cobalt transporter [Leptolyngbya sp. Heron Island J]